jgi:hypothetical protein
MSQENIMHSVLTDLQVAETRLHELHIEAEHERLVKAALKLRRSQAPRSRLSRYLDALRGHNSDGSPVEAHKN